MAHQITTSYVKDSIDLFRYYKNLADRAMAQCPDAALFTTLDTESNSIAIIVKHMSGNMRSRWSDFLTTDGEKPDRNRDTEFEEPPKTRADLLELWERVYPATGRGIKPLPQSDFIWPSVRFSRTSRARCLTPTGPTSSMARRRQRAGLRPRHHARDHLLGLQTIRRCERVLRRQPPRNRLAKRHRGCRRLHERRIIPGDCRHHRVSRL